jgi:hypothetical protein
MQRDGEYDKTAFSLKDCQVTPYCTELKIKPATLEKFGTFSSFNPANQFAG